MIHSARLYLSSLRCIFATSVFNRHVSSQLSRHQKLIIRNIYNPVLPLSWAISNIVSIFWILACSRVVQWRGPSPWLPCSWWRRRRDNRSKWRSCWTRKAANVPTRRSFPCTSNRRGISWRWSKLAPKIRKGDCVHNEEKKIKTHKCNQACKYKEYI